MSFLSVGNLITIGIVFLLLVLFRYLNQSNKATKLAKEYGKKLKEDLEKELSSFVVEKESALRDSGILLKGTMKQAEILLGRVQENITLLDTQSEKLNGISTSINSYNDSLSELDDMTARVQINLSRIQDESAYIENTKTMLLSFKDKLNLVDKSLNEMQDRIESGTKSAVAKSSEEILTSVQTTVNDLQKTAESVRKDVEEQREALNTALTNAGSMAYEIENKAFEVLIEESNKRKKDLEKELLGEIADLNDSVNSRIDEINTQVNTAKDNWQDEKSKILSEQQSINSQWMEKVNYIDGVIVNLKEKTIGTQKDTDEKLAATSAKIDRYQSDVDKTVADLVTRLGNVAEEVNKKCLEEADARLFEYRQAQNKQFESLENLANDVHTLDDELRAHLRNMTEKTSADFSAMINGLQTSIDTINQEINELKTQSYDRVSANLKIFEDDFSNNLLKRGETIDITLAEYKTTLTGRLSDIEENLNIESRKLERIITESMQKKKTELDGRLDGEISLVKQAAANLEGVVRNYTDRAEKTIQTYQDQVKTDLDEIRNSTDANFKNEAKRLTLDHSETMKTYQRDIELAQKAALAEVESKNAEITELLDSSKNEIEKYQSSCNNEIAKITASIDDLRKQSKELSQNNDQQLSVFKNKIDDLTDELNEKRSELLSQTEEKVHVLETLVKNANNSIQNFFDQTKIIDLAEEARQNLNRRIDDLNAEIEKTNLRRAELIDIESKITKIKRIEDELSTKMSQFEMEQHKLERMEKDFDRLLQTQKSVEEKLVDVTSTDDALQDIQIKIRKLIDSMTEVEEKYQRLEKKNQALETTTDGIDRNFNTLQNLEKTAAQFSGDVQRISLGLEDIRKEIETLAADTEKTKEAAEKAGNLDKTLKELEVRIKQMNEARIWLADTETRLNETYAKTKEHFELIGKLIKKDGEKSEFVKKGSISLQTQRDVIRLKKEKFSNEEIARNLNLSIGAVELIIDSDDRSDL